MIAGFVVSAVGELSRQHRLVLEVIGIEDIMIRAELRFIMMKTPDVEKEDCALGQELPIDPFVYCSLAADTDTDFMECHLRKAHAARTAVQRVATCVLL